MTATEPGPAGLFDLTGKVALVTGGSRGLGREMVLAFAGAGADVIIASRKLDNCQALAGQVEAAVRHGDRGELQGPVPAVASAASSYTTGSLIRVDGGLY